MAENLVKNTLTNYLVVAVRFIQGILVTRWSIIYLGTENYGLWAVLWTVFAYSLLVDFGLGASAQKYTGMRIFRSDIDRYNRVISAVLAFYIAMAVLILLVSFALSFCVGTLFNVSSPEKIAYCHSAFLIFAVGSALTFPTTVFPEIAIGLQKLYLRNYVNTVSKIIELFATLLLFKLGGQVRSLTVLVLGLSFLSNIVIGIVVCREIPGFHLTLRIGLPIYREIVKFSGFVYIVSIARLIMNRSSRLIISFFLGLPAAGIFHQASRLGDFCYMGAAQYQENVRPVTAKLHGECKTAELAEFILRSLKINLGMGIFFMLPSFIFAAEWFRFLFHVGNPEVFFLAKLFLVSVFLSITLRQGMQGYLIMADHHRLLSYATIVEAILMVGLNCWLIRPFGLAVILINSMTLQTFITLTVLLPVTLKSLHLPLRRVLFHAWLPMIAAALPGTAAAVEFKQYFEGKLSDFWLAFCGSSICCGLFLVTVWLFTLNGAERAELRTKVIARLPARFRPNRGNVSDRPPGR